MGRCNGGTGPCARCLRRPEVPKRRLPKATGWCRCWCQWPAVIQGQCQAGEDEAAAASSRGGDLARICPDSPLKDVQLQSPTVTRCTCFCLRLPVIFCSHASTSPCGWLRVPLSPLRGHVSPQSSSLLGNSSPPELLPGFVTPLSPRRTVPHGHGAPLAKHHGSDRCGPRAGVLHHQCGRRTETPGNGPWGYTAPLCCLLLARQGADAWCHPDCAGHPGVPSSALPAPVACLSWTLGRRAVAVWD